MLSHENTNRNTTPLRCLASLIKTLSFDFLSQMTQVVFYIFRQNFILDDILLGTEPLMICESKVLHYISYKAHILTRGIKFPWEVNMPKLSSSSASLLKVTCFQSSKYIWNSWASSLPFKKSLLSLSLSLFLYIWNYGLTLAEREWKEL